MYIPFPSFLLFSSGFHRPLSDTQAFKNWKIPRLNLSIPLFSSGIRIFTPESQEQFKDATNEFCYSFFYLDFPILLLRETYLQYLEEATSELFYFSVSETEK